MSDEFEPTTSINDTKFTNRLNRGSRKAALAIMLAAESANDRSEEAAKVMRLSVLEIYHELRERQFQDAVELANRTSAVLKEIDSELQAVSPRWKLERIAPVDRNILRLGAFELLHLHPEAPRSVILEYVSIGNEFGEQNTHAFVNGLLDQLCQNHGIVVK